MCLYLDCAKILQNGQTVRFYELGGDTPTSSSDLLIREHNIRAFNLLYVSGVSDKLLCNNRDGKDECNVLEEGYMRLNRMLRSIR